MPILSGAIWTFATYAISISLRLMSNIILSRLLAPELIGIVVVVTTIRVGIELFSDLGLEQNVVNHPEGKSQDFINTVWTLQIIRGIFLTVIFFSISPFLADIYRIDLSVFMIIAFAPLINSFASTSIFILVKDLAVRKRYTFEVASEFIGFMFTVCLVWIWPNVWAVVAGTLASIAIRSALSHFLPHPTHKLTIVRKYAWEIIQFGKWIMLSSLLMYASTQVDKIYLGKVLPLEVFGIYGLARTIADLPANLAGRLCYQIIFPLISASKHLGVAAARQALAPHRWKLLLLTCVGMSVLIGWSDYAIKIIYDPRYYSAGWMLCVLLVGAWFAVMSGLNEAVLLSEKPIYHSISHSVRLVGTIIGLSLGFATYGTAGAIAAVALSEICRYLALAFGQYRVRFSFAKQDFLLSLVLVILVAGWSALRVHYDLGLAWDGMFVP